MQRRTFITNTALAIGGVLISPDGQAAHHQKPFDTSQWKGFNLVDKFDPKSKARFRESDILFMKEHGFRFARIPLSYWCWSSPENWRAVDEQQLREIDELIDLGIKHGIHINLNLHRIPGYCINPPEEPFNLWKDDQALEAASFHWSLFAKRYKSIPHTALSYDLINEPARGKEEDYVRVANALVNAIHTEDPQRVIVADGWEVGRMPVHALSSTGLIQSTRGYDPMMISHYKAGWWGYKGEWPETLQWPSQDWDKERVYRERILPWKELEKKGVPIHVGEWGCYNQTPHAIALAWMETLLGLWKEAGWGWCLWNLRGSFGVLNSGRSDVAYEDYRGMKLDRKMLQLLMKYI